ncbi:hypothetical protein GY45DRAFT_783603 [Cubamyces sp. BRFM 1775]|nr:hypothetical protein GY45DRAFT_783603 [Cubamyces sp. BRFM 1775]
MQNLISCVALTVAGRSRAFYTTRYNGCGMRIFDGYSEVVVGNNCALKLAMFEWVARSRRVEVKAWTRSFHISSSSRTTAFRSRLCQISFKAMFFAGSDAFSFTFAALGSSGTPFSEICNTTSTSLPHSQPTRGSENLDPRSSPKAVSYDVSDEEKVLSDMGIEDPEEDEQLEIFNSIPGFDDDWEEENAAAAKTLHWQCGLKEEQTGDYATHHTAYATDTEDLGDVCDEEDGDGDSSDLSSVTSGVADGREDLEEGCELSSITSSDSEFDEPDEESAVEDDAALEDGEACYSDGSELSSSSVTSEAPPLLRAVDHTQEPPIRAVRRSVRIAAARRDRDQDAIDWTAHSPRPTKRARTLGITSAHDESSQARQRKGKGAHKQAKRRPPCTERRKEVRMDTETPAARREGSRSGRIPISFLKSCIATSCTTVSCRVKNCTTKLDIMKPFETRSHLRAHHKAQLKAAKIRCAWTGCGKTVLNGGNACGLIRHCDESHLKLRYHCPGKCVDRRGKMRTWCRSDELTRHEQKNPCDYLKKNPIPRSTKHADVDEG